MGYFPMCVDLNGKTVLLVGNGKQIAQKEEKLRQFGAVLRKLEYLTEADLTENTAFVTVGDTDAAEAERISSRCILRGIPVNVVDMPALSTFTFPATIVKGDLTVSISTGGKAPGGAAYLAKQIDQQLPDRTGEILDWLQEIRQKLYTLYSKEAARLLLSRVTELAFALGRPLTDVEAGI